MKSLYLIIDIKQDEASIFHTLVSLLGKYPIYALQIWNYSPKKDELVLRIKFLANENKIPIILNNDWKSALKLGLDGVHFDEMQDLNLKAHLSGLIIGFTIGNYPDKIRKAEQWNADYISFCSMFPSSTANSCELVTSEAVIKSKALFSKKIFLTGGITPQNLSSLMDLPYDGIALASGVFRSDNPIKSVNEYLNILNP